MKIIFDREKLNKSLQFVKNAIPKKEIEPILNNIYMRTLPEGKIQLVTTDLDLMSVDYLDAEIEGEGEMTIPGEKLIKLVQRLTGDKIEFVLNDTDISIKSGVYRGTFKTAGTDTYPVIKELLEQPKVVILEKGNLIQAFNRVKFAVNVDEARRNLMAVQLTNKGMVASNGKVTALYNQDFGVEELYISSNSLNDLIRILQASPADDVEVFADEAYLIFKLRESVFFTRRTNVKFPDVFSKIDKPTKEGNNLKIKFKVKELKSAIGRISLTASEETKAIRFITEKDSVKMVSSDAKGFEGEENIPAEMDGVEEGTEYTFNYDYILEVLSKWSSEDIEFRINEQIRMPCRLEEGNTVIFLMRLVE